MGSDDGRPAAAQRRATCDLVMKGGITSGVVYPAAVTSLSKQYDFVSIGGASAGAVAAAVTAAAQFARARGGLERFDAVRKELQQEGLLVRLFQPTKETRPLLDVMLGLQAARTSWQRMKWFFVRVLRRLLLPMVVWVAAAFAALAILLGHAGATWSSFTWPTVVVLVVLLVLAAVVAFVGLIGVRLGRAVTAYLPSSNYGMCMGLSEGVHSDRPDNAALTEWLHNKIQSIAQLADDQPLTFRTLQEAGINLLLTVTDLTWTRPVRMPCPDATYYFDRDEFSALFPGTVMQHLLNTAASDVECFNTLEGRPRRLMPLPGGDLPIVVAARMSLSFPVLLSAVPLWVVDAERPDTARTDTDRADTDRPRADRRTARRHWMSDGGISSNFPIHFFDAWVPGRPTFGLDLVQLNNDEPDPDTCVRTYMAAPPPPTTVPIKSLVQFLRQVLSTMQDWHDTLQSELTGFHDRIAHIELASNEGGLHITMPPATVGKLDEKGTEAGRKLCAEFDWDTHQLQRYQVFMGMLQDGLSPRPAAAGVPQPPTVVDAWRSGLGDRIRQYGSTTPPADPDRDAAWYAAAAEATDQLLADADRWLATYPDPPRLWFRPTRPLVPPASMRITPDV